MPPEDKTFVRKKSKKVPWEINLDPNAEQDEEDEPRSLIEMKLEPEVQLDEGDTYQRSLYHQVGITWTHLLACLGWVDFDLGCSTILPSCSASSANFPSAQAQLGR